MHTQPPAIPPTFQSLHAHPALHVGMRLLPSTHTCFPPPPPTHPHTAPRPPALQARTPAPTPLTHHAEVGLLPGVGHVDDPARLLHVHAVPHRRHVGGRVAKPAVALAHNQRDVVALRAGGQAGRGRGGGVALTLSQEQQRGVGTPQCYCREGSRNSRRSGAQGTDACGSGCPRPAAPSPPLLFPALVHSHNCTIKG